MDEDDFLLDEDDEDIYLSPEEMNSTSPEDDDGDSGDDDESAEVNASSYKGLLSENEVWLINAYNNITKCKDIEDAAFYVVSANPQHTNIMTVGHIIKDMFQKQGHSRLQATQYQQGLLSGGDATKFSDDDSGDLDVSINAEMREETETMIDNFVNFLVSRDLSKDSVTSRRRKQRHLPAFLIFMFSSGLYDLILNCPSMPAEYQEQITYAMKMITQKKYEILESMANKYDEVGRHAVAEEVRSAGISWFYREPAEVRTAAQYRHLNLTAEDIEIYKEFRAKYTNITTALTQDFISEYIEVVIDQKKGIYEKLKDKTRSEAINDVKRVFKDWVKQYQPENTGLADKLIFKS